NRPQPASEVGSGVEPPSNQCLRALKPGRRAAGANNPNANRTPFRSHRGQPRPYRQRLLTKVIMNPPAKAKARTIVRAFGKRKRSVGPIRPLRAAPRAGR